MAGRPVGGWLTGAMAGYSGTPLATKLGIKDGRRLGLLDAPDGFPEELRQSGLPPDVVVRTVARGPLDVIVAFHVERRRLERRFDTLVKALVRDGGLWVAWPKRASGVPTDMTEDVVRAVALPRGLVDNKVCAIDATWSGLRVVWRRELR
jgi:hypothetical protein